MINNINLRCIRQHELTGLIHSSSYSSCFLLILFNFVRNYGLDMIYANLAFPVGWLIIGIVYLTGLFLLIPLKLDWINFGTVKILYMILEHSCREPKVVVKCCVRKFINLVYRKVISRCGHRGFGLRPWSPSTSTSTSTWPEIYCRGQPGIWGSEVSLRAQWESPSWGGSQAPRKTWGKCACGIYGNTRKIRNKC